MNNRKIFFAFLVLCNVIGIVYLMALGWLNVPAQDDYSSLMQMRLYGFNSPIVYWYLHWQGRFSGHYLINTALVLWQHHVPLVVVYALIFANAVFGVYNLFKNTLAYFEIDLGANRIALANVACFLVLVSVYSNFEFNTFYWIVTAVMYVSAVVFFILGISEIINKGSRPVSFVVVALSFLFVGGSSENFAFVTIILTGILMLAICWQNRSLPISSILKITPLQKAILALGVNSVAFLIMVTAPGNKVRMTLINGLYKGYKTIPVPFAHLPSEVLSNYKIMLVLIIAKLPLILCAFPVFMVMGALINPQINKAMLLKMVAAIIAFVLLLAVFISPTVYATGGVGPLRAITYVAFFVTILSGYLAFMLGNMFASHIRAMGAAAICMLALWSGFFIHDTWKQVPQMQKYNASDKTRMEYIATLKAQNRQGVVVLDSLYTPHFKSYTNVLRNQIMDKLKRHNIIETFYYEITYDPLVYDEVSIDTASFLNTDLRHALDLPFAVQLKH